MVVASYDGTRDHPAVLSRAAWANIPDEGARALEATLVACDDLEPPGDMDYPHLWQPPATDSRLTFDSGRYWSGERRPTSLAFSSGGIGSSTRDADEAPQVLLEPVALVATRAVGEVLPRLLHLLVGQDAVEVRLHHRLAVVTTTGHSAHHRSLCEVLLEDAPATVQAAT